MTDLDRPAFEHPVLRQSVRDVLNTTILKDALAGDQMRELISDLIEAFTEHRGGTSGMWNVLHKAGCDPVLSDELSERLSRALMDAAGEI